MVKSKKIPLTHALKINFYWSGGILFLIKPQMKTSFLPFSINPLTLPSLSPLAPNEDKFCLAETLGNKFVTLSCPISLVFNFMHV